MSEKPWEVPLSNEEQADLFGQMGKWLKNGGMTSKSFVPSEMQNMFRMVATIVLLRAQHAAQAAEIERKDDRIRMLTIELDGAVNHHDYTRNKVDRALGEPRFNDCDIWTAFERAIAAKDATIAAQAAEIERLKGERQMSAGFDPASDNGDESAVILMCFNCAYAGPRGEDDEGNVCCPECGARAMEASNG